MTSPAGGHDVETHLGRNVTSQAQLQNVTAVLVAQAGYALDAARLVSPAAMRRLRAFQRRNGHALLRWACDAWTAEHRRRARTPPVPAANQ